MSQPLTVILLDRSPLADIADDVIHHVVGAGESVGLVAVDRPVSDYTPGFAAELTLPEGAIIERVVALVSSRTLRRLVDGDPEPALELLRTALLRATPTLLAVSEDPDTGLDAVGWERVAAFLRGTSSRWLDIPTGEVRDAAVATRPPEDFDLHGELYPPFWAESWSWGTTNEKPSA